MDPKDAKEEEPEENNQPIITEDPPVSIASSSSQGVRIGSSEDELNWWFIWIIGGIEARKRQKCQSYSVFADHFRLNPRPSLTVPKFSRLSSWLAFLVPNLHPSYQQLTSNFLLLLVTKPHPGHLSHVRYANILNPPPMLLPYLWNFVNFFLKFRTTGLHSRRRLHFLRRLGHGWGYRGPGWLVFWGDGLWGRFFLCSLTLLRGLWLRLRSGNSSLSSFWLRSGPSDSDRGLR